MICIKIKYSIEYMKCFLRFYDENINKRGGI